MSQARYFELLDHIGVEPPYTTDPKTGRPVENPKAGELQPLVSETLTIAVPTMVGKDVIAVPQSVTLGPVKQGSRVVKTDDPLVADALANVGKYREIDPPKSEQPRKPTTTARKED